MAQGRGPLCVAAPLSVASIFQAAEWLPQCSAPGLFSTGLWGSRAPGSAIVLVGGEKSRESSGNWRVGIYMYKTEKRHCFIKCKLFKSKHIRNSALSEAVISNLEPFPLRIYSFNLVSSFKFFWHLIFIVSAIFPISQCTLSALSQLIKWFICRVILLFNKPYVREVNFYK